MDVEEEFNPALEDAEELATYKKNLEKLKNTIEALALEIFIEEEDTTTLQELQKEYEKLFEKSNNSSWFNTAPRSPLFLKEFF